MSAAIEDERTVNIGLQRLERHLDDAEKRQEMEESRERKVDLLAADAYHGLCQCYEIL